MVRLILKYLNKIKQLFVIVPVLIGIMIVAGLFFANEKSKPEFNTKADRVMFETKDQSPKYVMTLPEKSLIVNDENIEEKTVELQKPERHKTNNEKLNELEIPFLSRLKTRSETLALSHVLPSSLLVGADEEQLKLPIKNGTMQAWEVYGRKTDVLPMFAKVAVVIKNMGVNKINSDLIIKRLSSNVSLSFSPYALALDDDIRSARENGHETYLDLILPSRNFLKEDSGPSSLDFNLGAVKNIEILEKLLVKNIAVGGFVVRDGIDDEIYASQIEAVMTMLEKRGLLLLNATYGDTIEQQKVQGLDRVKADIIIDSHFNRKSIDTQLKQAEQIAYRKGSVVVVLEPKPVAVLAVAEWVETFSRQLSYAEMKEQNVTTFEKPLALVPLSNLAVEY